MKEQAIALKEWASAIEALRTGKQVLIMRKGGIREETKDFEVQQSSFYLYPTYEHQKGELIKEEYQETLSQTLQGWSSQDTVVTISCYAELAEDILITTQEELDRLRSEHIWTDRFAEERLKWKKDKPLHLMLLRVYELDEPVRIPIESEYIGCKSWIGLPPELLSGVARKPVLGEEEFTRKANAVKTLLL